MLDNEKMAERVAQLQSIQTALPVPEKGADRVVRNAKTATPLEVTTQQYLSNPANDFSRLVYSTNAETATIDFETRSACSLKHCGSWRYSLDPTTEVMCLAFRLPFWERGRTALWHPAFPHLGVSAADCPELADLFAWIKQGKLVEAHNAWFERGIWVNICETRFGWPAIPHKSWRCSAAKAAAHSLPRSLEKVSEALRLKTVKDLEGAKTMKKMAKPRKPLKRDAYAWLDDHAALPVPSKKCAVSVVTHIDGTYGLEVSYEATQLYFTMPVLWHESAELLHILFAYCRKDVLAEEAVSRRLRDLSPKETAVYLMDQAINQHGFQLDREGIEAALSVVTEINTTLNAELVEITEGFVEKATQRARMITWFNENGVAMTDTQGDTIDSWLKRKDLSAKARRALELVRALGRSSTAKFVAAQFWADPDTWRVHGGLLYHGATTGRWSGSGVQPHNFPRGNIKDMDLAWETIKTRDSEMMGFMYGDSMTLLSYSLRGMIVPTPGRKLMVADYAAIEARVLLWLAEDDEALDVFRRGECIYMAMATEIYGRPITDKVKQADERQMGKQAVLGLGYQMGAKKFHATLAEKWGIFIEMDFAEMIVAAYREKFHRVKNMWWKMNEAAIAATKTPGRVVRCGRILWKSQDGFLQCRLPSGRGLSYSSPAVAPSQTPWGAVTEVLTFMAMDPYTKKWRRQDTYGGMLVENITQAVARDLMADAMLRCQEDGVYDVILSVHDELIAECDLDKGSVREFEALMAHTEEWAAGCPVSAEGWSGFRYKK